MQQIYNKIDVSFDQKNKTGHSKAVQKVET